MNIEYDTNGTCSRHISIELDGKKIKSVKFTGGCHGNTQGVAALAEGMDAETVIARCSGIKCGNKATSCPDQLARALRQAVETK